MSTDDVSSAPLRGRDDPKPSGRAGETLSRRSTVKRHAILRAAGELFGERGIGRAGMRELAAEAAVSTATIYAHFPDKRALLKELIDQRWEAALASMVERAAEIPDPLERLLTGITALNHSIAADPILRQLLVRPRRAGDAHIEERVGSIEDMMDARCAEAIRAVVAAGRLACADPEALAVLIRVSMQGWLLTEAKRRRPTSAERVTRALTALLRAASSPASGA
jgi:AcrR family transcriptional regulator